MYERTVVNGRVDTRALAHTSAIPPPHASLPAPHSGTHCCRIRLGGIAVLLRARTNTHAAHAAAPCHMQSPKPSPTLAAHLNHSALHVLAPRRPSSPQPARNAPPPSCACRAPFVPHVPAMRGRRNKGAPFTAHRGGRPACQVGRRAGPRLVLLAPPSAHLSYLILQTRKGPIRSAPTGPGPRPHHVMSAGPRATPGTQKHR